MNPKPITRNLAAALTLLSLADCQLLPENPIDMGGPEAMPMDS